ncbi:VOC family protein [Ornithinibacillus salinisoli]|uniref:VOC family protein n=1 Tax=Ornithinibacillus salinisoli TaxID=1848459 RepID=A0ABW4W3Z1_9BACI
MAKPIENRVDTIFIHVKDIKESVHWYSKLLGVEIEGSEVKGPIYTFNMGAGRPGLTLDDHSLDKSYDFRPSNQPLFNFSAKDIDTAFQYVREIGAEIVTEIQIFPDLSEFTFKDPDGNVLMVCDCFSK